MTDKDEPVAGAMNAEDPAGALAPPERHRKLSRNRAMVTVIVIVVVCVAVVAIALALG